MAAGLIQHNSKRIVNPDHKVEGYVIHVLYETTVYSRIREYSMIACLTRNADVNYMPPIFLHTLFLDAFLHV